MFSSKKRVFTSLTVMLECLWIFCVLLKVKIRSSASYWLQHQRTDRASPKETPRRSAWAQMEILSIHQKTWRKGEIKEGTTEKGRGKMHFLMIALRTWSRHDIYFHRWPTLRWMLRVMPCHKFIISSHVTTEGGKKILLTGKKGIKKNTASAAAAIFSSVWNEFIMELSKLWLFLF